MTAYDLTTGRRYEVEVRRETKCYYIGFILNYSLKAKYPFRIHKSTMEMDYRHLTFSLSEEEEVNGVTIEEHKTVLTIETDKEAYLTAASTEKDIINAHCKSAKYVFLNEFLKSLRDKLKGYNIHRSGSHIWIQNTFKQRVAIITNIQHLY